MTDLDIDLIVFDGTCIFCSGFARFMARNDRKARFRFVTAQSEKGRVLYHRYGLDPDLMETNIVIVDGVAHVKMAAFAAAVRAIGWPWRLFAVLGYIPQPLSDWLYDRIARNRYLFGRRKCVLPSDELRGRIVD
ncbi:thiol-disulfide oxidoreductase DCC family protein [Profundibacter sp.]|uniref:thiol-disulfide oxidoreductase DCC family protein n=1 Tax=Profundibacter sp. TaxID=3101071 RepID=UPI003D113466